MGKKGKEKNKPELPVLDCIFLLLFSSTMSNGKESEFFSFPKKVSAIKLLKST
jgi:hypothetical protein